MIDRQWNPMVAALDAKLDPGLPMRDRLVALTDGALDEIGEALVGLSAKPKLELFLALPEYRPGFSEDDAAYVRRGLLATTQRPLELSSIGMFPYGHAAGALALREAMARVERTQEPCIVGGVESYFDPKTMRWLDDNLQLVGEETRSSFIPGEGAGLLLLSPQGRQTRLPHHGSIVAVGLATERALIKSDDLCVGAGLTQAVDTACSQLGSRRINDIFCDINGERYRAEEWGFVCLRSAHYFDDATDYRSPAGNWGDMGAASIPLFAMLACRASAGGYARGPNALVWASSEGGQRAAVVMDTGPRGRN